MDGWMSGWMGGWLDEWRGGWVGGWTDGRMNRWLDEWMDFIMLNKPLLALWLWYLIHKQKLVNVDVTSGLHIHAGSSGNCGNV